MSDLFSTGGGYSGKKFPSSIFPFIAVLPKMEGMRLLRTFLPVMLLTILFSCSSLRDLRLDNAVFFDDTIQAVLAGEKFRVSAEDFEGIRQLLADEDPQLRRAGLILAGQAEDERLYPDIFRASADENTDVSETALNVIRTDAESFQNYLLGILANENSPERINALTVLSFTGNDSIVPKIIPYFDDGDPEVRNNASLAVQRLTDRNNSSLQIALNSENTRIAAIAYRTLGRYTHIEDIPLFIESFTSPETEIRKEAQLSALRYKESGLPFLHAEAGNLERSLPSRLAVLNVIQGLRSPESLSTLIFLLKDPEEMIRKKSSAILGTYGVEAIPALIRLLADSDEDSRIQALRLMGEIGAAEAFPALVNSLGDSSAQVRETALQSLESFGTEAWPLLRETIASGERGRAAIMALRILRSNKDKWLLRLNDGQINQEAVYLLILSTGEEDIETYLASIDIDPFTQESVLNLKSAWIIAEEFMQLETGIASNRESYLYFWRQREILIAESREVLKKSFDVLHQYFDTSDPLILKESKELRDESRRLEIEAQFSKSRMEEMPAAVQNRGQSRLNRYKELRNTLIRVWQYIDIDFRPVARELYISRGVDPEIISRESAVLE